MFFTLLCVFACLVVQSAGTRFSRSAYDETLAKSLVHYAAAAHCQDIIKGGGFDCSSCKHNEGALVANTFHFAKRDVNCAIFVHHEQKRIVLAFTGTDPKSLRNIIADLTIKKWPSGGGKVHVGFLDSWIGLRDAGAASEFEALATLYPDYTACITGHSLGGAMAQLAAADIAQNFKTNELSLDRLRLYTYGQPKVGDSDWVQWANALFTFPNFRVIRWRDIVISVPPIGFSVTNNEVFYQEDMNSYEFCASGTDDCSHDLWFHNSFDQHATYFGIFVGWDCYPTFPTPMPTPAPTTTTTQPPAPTPMYTGPTKCFDLKWFGVHCLRWNITEPVMQTTIPPESEITTVYEPPQTTGSFPPGISTPAPQEQTFICESTVAHSHTDCFHGLFDGEEGACTTKLDCEDLQRGSWRADTGATSCSAVAADHGCCTLCKVPVAPRITKTNTAPLTFGPGPNPTTTNAPDRVSGENSASNSATLAAIIVSLHSTAYLF